MPGSTHPCPAALTYARQHLPMPGSTHPCPAALTHARCEDAVGPGAAAVLARVARARVVTQRALTVLAVVITAPALVAKLRPREEEALQ